MNDIQNCIFTLIPDEYSYKSMIFILNTLILIHHQGNSIRMDKIHNIEEFADQIGQLDELRVSA